MQSTPTIRSIDLNGFAEVGIWCSLPAALSTRPITPRVPQLHVHLRPNAGGSKTVDRDFPLLSLVGETPLEITPHAAFEYILAVEFGNQAQKSATLVPSRILNLDEYAECDYTIWASTPAVIWTSARAQEQGIHVHVQRNGKYIVDETFGEVWLKGKQLNRKDLLEMMLSRVC